MASTRSPILFAVDADRTRLGALNDLTTAEGMIFESVRNILTGTEWEGSSLPGPSFIGANFGHIRASQSEDEHGVDYEVSYDGSMPQPKLVILQRPLDPS